MNKLHKAESTEFKGNVAKSERFKVRKIKEFGLKPGSQ